MTGARDEGQAAVELALVLPLLVVLLLAVVQVALVARDQVLVVHAARAGARQAAVDPDPLVVRRAVAEASGLDGSSLVVDTITVGSSERTVTTRVRYTARTNVALLGPLLPDVPLEASAAMRSELSGSTPLETTRMGPEQEPVHPGTNPST